MEVARVDQKKVNTFTAARIVPVAWGRWSNVRHAGIAKSKTKSHKSWRVSVRLKMRCTSCQKRSQDKYLSLGQGNSRVQPRLQSREWPQETTKWWGIPFLASVPKLCARDVYHAAFVYMAHSDPKARRCVIPSAACDCDKHEKLITNTWLTIDTYNALYIEAANPFYPLKHGDIPIPWHFSHYRRNLAAFHKYDIGHTIHKYRSPWAMARTWYLLPWGLRKSGYWFSRWEG